MSRRKVPNALARAFDEAQFGAGRTLNLRDGLPSGADAAARADAWLRLKQVEGVREVLIITGRGLHSPGSVPVVRTHVAQRLASLRRAGIVEGLTEHTAGSYVVRLAPAGTSLVDAARRPRSVDSRALASVAGLSMATQRSLRELADHALHSLGIQRSSRSMLADEMRRQAEQLTRDMPGDANRDQWLREAAQRALNELE